MNNIITGDSLETLYGVYAIMGLWKDFGTRLIKQITAGNGQALKMGLVTVRYASKVRNITATDWLMSCLLGLYRTVCKLTTCVEIALVAIPTTLMPLLQKLMFSAGGRGNHYLKVTA